MCLETRLWSPLICTQKAFMGVDIQNYAKVYLFTIFFSFLIINYYNFTYIFTLHHCSAICWNFILRLICLDMCIIFLFVSVIILFVYDSNRYGTAETSGKKLFMRTIYGFQSLLSVIGGFAWNVLAVPDPPLLLNFFSVTNIMICLELSFS